MWRGCVLFIQIMYSAVNMISQSDGIMAIASCALGGNLEIDGMPDVFFWSQF